MCLCCSAETGGLIHRLFYAQSLVWLEKQKNRQEQAICEATNQQSNRAATTSGFANQKRWKDI